MDYNEHNRKAFSFLENDNRITYINSRIENVFIRKTRFDWNPVLVIELLNHSPLVCPLNEISKFVNIFKNHDEIDIGKGWTSEDFIGKYVRLCYSRDTVKFDFDSYLKDLKKNNGDVASMQNKYWIVIGDGDIFEFCDDSKLGCLIAVKFIVDENDYDDPVLSHQNENTWMYSDCDMTNHDEYEHNLKEVSKLLKKFNARK